MKMGKMLVLGLSVLLALGGCTPSDSGAATSSPAVARPSADAPSTIPAPIPAPSPSAESTPIKTTQPDPIPTPVLPTPTPVSTPKSTVAPAKTSTPAPADDGRVTLADGFYYVKLSADIKERITGISYPKDDSDIEINYSDLRYVRIKYYDFDGKEHKNGELIVNKKLAKDVTQIFLELYEAKYPLASVRLVDDYGQPGDDTLSMEDNNTSAFCYRKVTGSGTLSRHSLGAAIDVNPVQNPYIDGDRVAPENAAKYVDRSLGLPGMIDHDDLCYKVFKKHGWSWGGDWKGDKDYQHFSKSV